MNQRDSRTPTVASQVTPPGRGAVAVVRISGPGAEVAIATHFVPASGKPPREWPAGRIAFGRWGGSHGEEVIAARRGPSELELHCHGGAAAVGRVMGDLAEAGCTVVSDERLSGVSLVASEARRELAGALTLRAAGVLIDQLHGALDDAARRAMAWIQDDQFPSAAALLRETHGRYSLGCRLTTPWRVVLAGRPNAGKSSLLNAIVGYRRAIVHPEPGTTRDAIGETTAVDGWPVRLSDTAGLRAEVDPVEREGIRRTHASVAEADLVLWVRDLTVRSPEAETPPADPPRVVEVWNKRDLAIADPSNRKGVIVSALTGRGLEGLLAEIAGRLVPTPPAAGAAVPFLPRHEQQLAAALTACDAGRREEAIEQLAELAAPGRLR